jgi:hypothetical protein
VVFAVREEEAFVNDSKGELSYDRVDHEDEGGVVALAHAVVYPLTVVVESLGAAVTAPAVLAVSLNEGLAVVAEEIGDALDGALALPEDHGVGGVEEGGVEG